MALRARGTILGVLEGWEHDFGGLLGAQNVVLGLRSRVAILGALEGSEHVFEGFLGLGAHFL